MLKSNFIVQTCRAYLKDSLLFPTSGINDIDIIICDRKFRATLRRGKQTSHSWKDSLETYTIKAK